MLQRERAEFVRADFDARRFVHRELSHGWTSSQLEQLSARLRKGCDAVKHAVTELVNKDYGDFIALANSTGGTSAVLDQTASSLSGLCVSFQVSPRVSSQSRRFRVPHTGTEPLQTARETLAETVCALKATRGALGHVAQTRVSFHARRLARLARCAIRGQRDRD